MGLSTHALKPDSLDPNPLSRSNVVSRELHMARRLRPLHCWTRSYTLYRSTVTQYSTQPGSGSKPSGGNVVFGSGSNMVKSPNIERCIITSYIHSDMLLICIINFIFQYSKFRLRLYCECLSFDALSIMYNVIRSVNN